MSSGLLDSGDSSLMTRSYTTARVPAHAALPDASTRRAFFFAAADVALGRRGLITAASGKRVLSRRRPAQSRKEEQDGEARREGNGGTRKNKMQEFLRLPLSWTCQLD